MKRFVFGLLLGGVLVLVLLEGVLQLLPVNSGLRMASTHDEQPYPRYLSSQDYVYSFGWALNNHRFGKTNGAGFTNSLDQVLPGGILVVGDSYIEGLMLRYEDTLQGRLESKFQKKVAAVAVSGNNLADALRILESYGPAMKPGVAVLFVEPGDVDQILDIAGAGHNFFVRKDGLVSIDQLPYFESRYKVQMSKSALVRYVYYNLKFADWVSSALSPRKTPAPIADQSESKREVLRYFYLNLLKLRDDTGLRILLLLDGERKALYSPRAGEPKAWKPGDRELLLAGAAEYKFEVVDLDPIFAKHWGEKRERLDWIPMDAHWNPVAHRLAAEEILSRLAY